ncbi:MAG: glycosyltransferase [Thermoanaerobaculia bacterium]
MKGSVRGQIVLLTGNPLCRNPRVFKEATCLAEAGYEVEVLGAWTGSGVKAEDQQLLAGKRFQFTPVWNSESSSLNHRIRRFAARGLAKSSRLAHQAAGVSIPWQLGAVYGALAHAAYARRFDLAIAHSEPALAVAARLQRDGRRVGVDFEDWFSEDFLAEARSSRPVALLRAIESTLARTSSYLTCTSKAMAREIASDYGCTEPAVLYNSFPWADRTSIDGLLRDRSERRLPSIHWYSQTLGQGRGLEDLMGALPLVHAEAEVHLRGRPAAGFELWLRAQIPEGWRDRVFVHGLVPNAELLSRIAEHDIGFAGERSDCRSRDLTVTNKILHYLLAGLAVVASETTGQREIAAQASGAVRLYPPGDQAALAGQINRLLGSADELATARAVALAAAERTYCWERQEARLLEAVQKALR